MMKGGFKNWLSNFFSGSVIVRALGKASDFIYNNLGKGIYSFVFGSYDDMSETFEDGAIGSVQRKKRSRICRFLSKSIEESVYINNIASMMRYLSRLSMRVIGVFLLSFGLFSLMFQAIMNFIPSINTPVESAIIALVLVIAGGLLLLSKRALCRAVFDSKLFGGFFRNVAGFKDRSFDFDGEATGRISAAFLLGLPFGLLSIPINPLLILAGFIALIFAYIILLNPEFGYLIILFIVPFLVVLPSPSIILAALVIYTFSSYVIKLIMGKRYFKLDFLDVLVICFMGVIALGGFVSYGGAQSLSVAAIFIALMLGYFVTVGIVNNKDLLKRSVAALSLSMIAVAAIGLYQNFTGNISEEWIDTQMFEEISGRVVSTFENPNMLGEYLILLLPLVVAAMLGDGKMSKKPGYFVCFIAGAACLVFTWARGAWLGFLFSAVVFLLMWNRKAMGAIVAAIMALPLAIPYLPESIVSRFSSIGDLGDTSTNYRVYIWRGSANLASDYALTGIGVGEKAFDKIYPYYSFAGIEKAPHAHNLFLQLFIEVGIFGFLVFLAVLICMFQTGFSLAKNGTDKGVRLIGCGAMCGVLAALVQGMTDYIWYNYRVFLVFWIMIGLVSAARRIDVAMRQKLDKESSEYSVDITL